jgi:hypothetical protein
LSVVRVGAWSRELEVGGAVLRALRLEAKRNETGKGRNGETAKKEDRRQKAAIKLGTRESVVRGQWSVAKRKKAKGRSQRAAGRRTTRH